MTVNDRDTFEGGGATAPSQGEWQIHTRYRAVRRRGETIRWLLVVADVLALTAAFAMAELLFGRQHASASPVPISVEVLAFAVTLPGWLLLARAHTLYGRDDTRTNHSTADDVTGVLHVMSIGLLFFIALAWATGWAELNPGKLVTFWGFSIIFVVLGRLIARAVWRRTPEYVENTLILGDSDGVELLKRKISHHPEYGLSVVGTIPASESARQVADCVAAMGAERVIMVESQGSLAHQDSVARTLRNLNVQLDIVPSMYTLLGTSFDVHTIEGVPLLGLPTAAPSSASRVAKRVIDVAGASIGVIVASPLFLFIAWRIRRDSPGPVFFRQTRLGFNLREFEVLKFRTMTSEDHDSAHRTFITSAGSNGSAESNGLFKLAQDDAVTQSGRWLRRTSLDELPQLINVLRGEMSLVGPRPCIPYELEAFSEHHYERFSVLPGLTGLWQVTARAHASSQEALEMDVAYARSWTLGLDFWILLRTPFAVLRQRSGTA